MRPAPEELLCAGSAIGASRTPPRLLPTPPFFATEGRRSRSSADRQVPSAPSANLTGPRDPARSKGRQPASRVRTPEEKQGPDSPAGSRRDGLTATSAVVTAHPLLRTRPPPPSDSPGPSAPRSSRRAPIGQPPRTATNLFSSSSIGRRRLTEWRPHWPALDTRLGVNLRQRRLLQLVDVRSPPSRAPSFELSGGKEPRGKRVVVVVVVVFY